MARQRKPPSQTWRTFLENHVKPLVSTDFLGGVDRKLSFVVCVHSVESPSAAGSSLQRDGASDGGRDGATNRRSIALGQCTGLFTA
jgi:hypothetical protein